MDYDGDTIVKNAHLRFGCVTYPQEQGRNYDVIELYLDRFIGGLVPDPRRQAKAHFISAPSSVEILQISAISAAI